ncbi:hypothetical protein PT974_09181 [Cladobotryum mycophilum]|uniref:Uncharacterized protein n=1 Tax=Cladobotryum mycophilum TaxID=491253 RepID=A0ABR0SGU7_9HYPO
MANGFDRLERFFTAKRKASPAPVESGSPISQPSEPQFPSPSFIRPKASRMTARDEVRLRQANERSPSVPDIASIRLGSSHSRNSGLLSSSLLSRSPVRSPSLNGRRPEPLVMGLREFQFPNPPSRNGELTPMSMTFGSPISDAPQIPSPRSRSPLRLSITPRLDTPPSSDPEDNGSLPCIKIPFGAPPTPRESPLLEPMPDSPLTGSKFDLTLFDDFQDQLDDAFDQFSLNDSCSDSSLEPSRRLSYCSSTLREPDFNDFLNLSDDDIAETTPDSPELSPQDDLEPSLPTMDLSISSSLPLESSLLTLTPPRASRPAESGALMAARIANRYDFDLIYVVNLWPGNPTSQLFDDDFEVSGSDAGTSERPLIGRLLAAHGLHHVPSPLQISSLVHTTILGSDGWIEYRNTTARPQELARGYARAFYTGQYTRGSSSESSNGSLDLRSSEKIDRGIVFAAYRKPRAGDSKLGRSFSEEQLACLHDEAETLVNVLLDIHAKNRGRQPLSNHRLSDETGPILLY